MMGIYEIRNAATGEIYVGSTRCARQRFNQHRSQLRRGIHHNQKLQRSWNEWGEDQFIFELVVATSDTSSLSVLEQKRMDQLQEGHLNSMMVACRPPRPRSSILFDRDGRPTDKFPKAGDRHNSLTVISDEIIRHPSNGSVQTMCRCDCGSIGAYSTYYLVLHHTPKNCGCDRSHIGCPKHGATRSGRMTPEFKAWSRMRSWCTNPKDKVYDRYGGRGIKVCDRWLNDFAHFMDDMGPKPSIGHCLGRLDINGDFTPDNCEWSDMTKQNNRRRDTVMLTWNGETMSVCDWSRRTGISYKTIHRRLKMNWPIERTLSEPVLLGKNQHGAK